MKAHDKYGDAVSPGDIVETVSGRHRRVASIDSDGYARLEGEVSTVYVPHTTLLVPSAALLWGGQKT